ncbi:unnamed protein product [Ophioblennius macclurei]
MLQAVSLKSIFKILLIVVTFALALYVSFCSTGAPLAPEGQDGFRGIFKSLFPSWNNNCTKQVYVRPPPWSESLPTIYVITPTYKRFVQKADLTRMSNTLLHVANLHWIVVEDSENKTTLVRDLLEKTGLNYTHLNVHTSEKLTSRGSEQRNLALKWLRDTFNTNESHPGVVYFGDDDNTYSLELFEEMRYTKKVSVWPVGFTGAMRYQSCKVDASGKVYGWVGLYAPNRRFPVDMAGFAINLDHILYKSEVYFKLHNIAVGYQETTFLSGLAKVEDVEPRAANCTKVLVWHTRTSTPPRFQSLGDPNMET